MRRFLLVAALVSLMSAPLLALEPWRIVVRIAGKVESRPQGVETWSSIWRSRVLKDGDFARTLGGSKALVKLADGSEFSVGADTIIEMTKFQLTPEGRVVVLSLQLGRVRARGARALGRDSTFQVITPTGVMAARGTDFFVELNEERKCALMVYEGVVDASTAQGHRLFQAGDYGFVLPNGTIQMRPPDFNQQAPLGVPIDVDAPAQAQSGGGEGAAPVSPYAPEQGSATTTTTSGTSTTAPPIYQPGSSTPQATVPVNINL